MYRYVYIYIYIYIYISEILFTRPSKQDVSIIRETQTQRMRDRNLGIRD